MQDILKYNSQLDVNQLIIAAFTVELSLIILNCLFETMKMSHLPWSNPRIDE